MFRARCVLAKALRDDEAAYGGVELLWATKVQRRRQCVAGELERMVGKRFWYQKDLKALRYQEVGQGPMAIAREATGRRSTWPQAVGRPAPVEAWCRSNAQPGPPNIDRRGTTVREVKRKGLRRAQKRGWHRVQLRQVRIRSGECQTAIVTAPLGGYARPAGEPPRGPRRSRKYAAEACAGSHHLLGWW